MRRFLADMVSLAFFLPAPIQRANRLEGVACDAAKQRTWFSGHAGSKRSRRALFDQDRHRPGGVVLCAAAARAVGFHLLLPLRAQPGALDGIACVEEFGRDDAVGA